MTTILILAGVALAARLLLAWRPGWRGWVLFALSVLAVFWLQPLTAIRWLDFWLPLASLALAAWVWAATSERPPAREDGLAALALAGLALLLDLTRYLPTGPILTASRPPDPLAVLPALAAALAVGWLFCPPREQARPSGEGLPRTPAGGSDRFFWGRPLALPTLLFSLLLLFVILKTPALAGLAAGGLRALAGQSAALASPLDLRWLGFSYLAFRLIHTIRDRQAGRLPNLTLREYVTYAVFFPALTAGPIDRAERFVKDLRAPLPARPQGRPLTPLDWEALTRLTVGLFKKFALADALALIALNSANAAQLRPGAGWAWLLVYAYAFQIYFDFSGYTDIAIGLGLLLGIRLPENFNAPYRKPNLAQFWNNWHMSLTQWFRAYYFNPLTRALRGRKASPALTIFLTQVSTMLLIGLWHGVTLNFVLWGLWHGLGQFVQNRYSDWAKSHLPARLRAGWPARALHIGGVLLTFHYVAVGWVFFALADTRMAWGVLRRLIGM